MIKAITFDLDGVYFINGKSNFIASLGRLGVPEEDAKRVFLESDEMNKLYKRGKMTDKEFWTFAIKEWGLDISIDQIIKMLIDGYDINEGAVKIVRAVRKKGYKTCICSNNFPARINGLNERFKFLDDFDIVALSYQVGVKKPSDKIFQYLIDKSGVNPEEIIFVDDDEDNLNGAKKLGIQTFFYGEFDKFLEELRKLNVNW